MTRRAALRMGAAAACIVAAGPAKALSEKDNRMITNGGCRVNGTIRKVTSLADSGPGSLRAALSDTDGPTVIVFEVGGEIALRDEIHIRSSSITIAGQTAPEPGITLTGASMRVRANDVAIEHIAIRPGMDALPAERADGLTIGGGSRAVERVRVRNISASWSKDELASLARPTKGPVSVTHSIFAEALRRAGHPKGAHSMAMLVRDAPSGVVIAGNLFISNTHRNPVLASNTKAEVRNNWIVNPQYNAVHMYLDTDADKLVVEVRNNVMTPGQDTAGNTRAVSMPPPGEISYKASVIEDIENEVVAIETLNRQGFDNRAENQAATSELETLAVPNHVYHYAGSRPAIRNAVDQRILDDALAGRAAIVDRPPEDISLEPTTRPFTGPDRPFEQDPLGNTRLELWLEHLHVEMGGASGITLAPV